MKLTKIVIYAITITGILSSCAVPTYYQVYKATPTNKIVQTGNNLVYEDDNCKVSYNLWSEKGNIGFDFYNKTDNNIYINLDESFFIINGIANDYYKNRVFSNSKSLESTSERTATASKSISGVNNLKLLQTNKVQISGTSGLIASSGYSISYTEDKIICIPSNTSKNIAEYNINSSVYRDCDLFKYPTKKQLNTKSFLKSESPIVFSNRIAYTIGQSENLMKFENEFYISEVSNFSESDMFESKYDEYCGQKRMTMSKYFKSVAPNKFYIKYTKGLDGWKH